MNEISVSGATQVDEAIELHDDVVIVIIGECVRDGAAATATKGDVEKRTIQMQEAIVLVGKESVEFEQRARDEANARDAEKVKSAMGDPDEGDGADDLDELEA